MLKLLGGSTYISMKRKLTFHLSLTQVSRVVVFNVVKMKRFALFKDAVDC